MFQDSVTYEILSTLLFKVRLLTLNQAASTWWQTAKYPKRLADQFLKQLTSKGLLTRHHVLSPDVLPALAPVFTWSPGEALPDCAALSKHLRARYPDLAPKTTTVFIVSNQTALRFRGTPAKLPRIGQEHHDLQLSETYLHYFRKKPNIAKSWVGEELIQTFRSGFRIKVPDAMILDDNGQPKLIVECAGRYGPKQLRSFHEDRNERREPYELW